MDEKKPAAVPDEPVAAGKKNGKESRRNSKAPATNTDASHTLSQPEASATAQKPKRARKRRDDDDEKAKARKDKSTAGDKTEPKPRRQRTSNVKPAPESADASSSTAASRKKAKLEHKADEPAAQSTPASRQAKITDMVPVSSARAQSQQQQQQQHHHQQHQYSQHAPPTTPAQPSPQAQGYHMSQHSPPPPSLHAASYPSRNGSYEVGAPGSSQYAYHSSNNNNGGNDNNNTGSHHAPFPPARPASLPRSSGQKYDPIRSAIESSSSVSTPALPTVKPTPPHTSFSPPPNAVTPPPLLSASTPFRASASPAISSIIDPPVARQGPVVVVPRHSTTSEIKTGLSPTHLSVNSSADAGKLSAHPLTQSKSQDSNAMDIDSNPLPSKPSQKKTATSSAGNISSGTQSPRPNNSRNKEPSRPLPSTGSGLLSNTLFGGDANSSSDTKQLPSIILHIPLKGKSNLVINFARMAEEQYGFDALHPRIAAQKERRARLAAASADLEKAERADRGESGEDDLSLDANRDSDGDGDVTMSGMGTTLNDAANEEGATSGAPADVKKTRRRKIEEYDRDDPFVDDSELIWEEQAAACKDGFFVYSGLLVQEGDKVSVEKADGTTKRGRGRRGGASGTTHGNTGTSSRGRGGHAGSTTTHHPNGDGATAGKSGTGRGGARKPRITKADKVQMEKEKAEREKAAVGLSAKAASK